MCTNSEIMQRYNLTLMGMCEVRWTGHGETKLQTRETLLYSDKNEECHEAGVEILLSKKAANSLLEWNLVSDRIITARFESCFKKVFIIMCYAPTNTSEEEDKNSFYAQLQSVLDKIPNRDMLILMGDINAKVGADNTDREREMGRHGLEGMNENVEMLADFCSTNSLIIGGTIFSQRKCHKAIWVSFDKLTENQIDHVIVRQRYRSSLQDVRVRRSADIGSDHHLVVTKIKMGLSTLKNLPKPRKKFNVGKLKQKDTKQMFQFSLHNRFEVLQSNEAETVEQRWSTFKEAVAGACEDVLGRAHFRKKPWISDESWKKVEKRRLAKQEMNQAKTRQQKQQASDRHSALSKKVKKELRADKRMYFKTFADEAEEAASKSDFKNLYATTSIFSERHCNPNKPVKNKKGRLLTMLENQLARWKEHFQEVLNRPASEQRPQLNPSNPLDINIREITKEEIHKALSSWKNGKAAGTDNIPAETLKERETGIINHQNQLLNLIWATEKIPTEWSKRILVKLPKHGDLSQFGKWREITLLSIPSKVLTKIILEQMKDAIDNVLRDEQAGFRKERSCADQIATLRIIVEQSIE